ncbi:MAG: hypothetical protein CMI36_12595 [Owenweeksia sp.]|nr:hypothetical protein [Owenweeksia sp.]MBF99824.1 hypothetical protein [Owenweeksia sp.]HBF20218.1 hypothetical protein [Cryomorphaceae bacterium]HCQ17358.1 hypothetical protein [Cryomorphaceae bacterium]|tara:strand:+ start:2918 stop:4132 length:1215 start_codon:yes stop_codon:yes gene_type:complete
MLKNIVYQLYFFLSYLIGYGQSVELHVMASLPEELEECSGMVYRQQDQKVVFINDSGNRPEILATDLKGKLTQQYCLPGAVNVDWEDLTQDDEGYLYIGDFGNNRNRRKDLVIYKVDAEMVLSGNDSFELQEIHYSYEDQNGFPPDQEDRNFDMEAMVHIGDSLYLFSKNRTSPFDGYTYCYRLPDNPGEFIAEKVDSFKTGSGMKESYWIAAADFREDPRTLLLLGYDKVWMFYYFEGTRFFSGKHNVLYFNSFTQKESISFYEDNKVLLSDEKNNSKDGKLYFIELPEILMNTEALLQDTSSHTDSITAGPRYFQDSISIGIYTTESSTVLWEAFSTNGQRLHFGKLGKIEAGHHHFQLDTFEWTAGGYVLNILVNGRPHGFKLSKPLTPKKNNAAPEEENR